jgi:hypothetical protein
LSSHGASGRNAHAIQLTPPHFPKALLSGTCE